MATKMATMEVGKKVDRETGKGRRRRRRRRNAAVKQCGHRSILFSCHVELVRRFPSLRRRQFIPSCNLPTPSIFRGANILACHWR